MSLRDNSLIRLSVCERMHLINSLTALLETTLISNFSLMAFPNLASATSSSSSAPANSFLSNYDKMKQN